MTRTLSIVSVGLNEFQCMFECFQRFFDFRLLCNCIIWGYWYLVMYKLTLVFGSINTFILHHYFFRRMLLDYSSIQTSQHVGCRPYCWSSSRSLMTMAALVRHIRFFRAATCVLLKDLGYGGWFWWQKTTWSTTHWESRLPWDLPASVSKTPK